MPPRTGKASNRATWYPLEPKVVGHRQAGRTGTDHGHLFRALIDVGPGQGLQVDLVRGEAFQLADGHGLVPLPPPAGRFAGVRADPAQDPGQRQPLHDQADGFPVLALPDELDVALHVDPGRTGGHAGGPVIFVDAKGDGHGLGKGAVNGTPQGKPFVPEAGHGHGADLGAFAAARAGVFAHVPGLAADLDGVVADKTGHLLDFAVGEEFDVWILGHLDHLGGADAGRAVQGRKGLVELEHVSADGGRPLDQVDLVPGISDVQGGLHAGDTAADDHDVRMDRYLPGGQGLVIIDPADGRRGQTLGLARRLVFVLGHPGDLLPHRGHLKHIGVEAGPLAGPLEGLFVKPGRARGHDHPRQTQFPDVFFNQLLARVGTHEFVVPRHDHVAKLAGEGRHLLDPHLAGDVDPAVTNVKSDSDRHRLPLC